MFFYQLETRHANGDLMLRDALPSPRQFSYEIRIVLTVRCFEQPEIHSEKQLFRQKKKKKKKDTYISFSGVHCYPWLVVVWSASRRVASLLLVTLLLIGGTKAFCRHLADTSLESRVVLS